MPNKNYKYTLIKETIIEDTVGNRIRAGVSYKSYKQSLHTVHVIKPKQLIAFQHWTGGLYGTTKWLLYIFRTNDRQIGSILPNVFPAVNLLFFCSGATRVKRTLKLIEQLELAGFKFSELSNEYWIHQHSRIQSGKPLVLPKHVKQFN